MIANPAAIQYDFVMDEGTYKDQGYDVRAVSYCRVGGDFVTTESNLIMGIKDTYLPRLFGSPQPANGVLTATDNIRLNFNEPIAAGKLNESFFKVTGIRNGSRMDHAVSIAFNGQSSYLATEFEKSFTGKTITVELWMKAASATTGGTLFSHGNSNELLELALTSDKRLQVTVGTKTLYSEVLADYAANQWRHVALVYNDARKTVSAYFNMNGVINGASVNAYTGTGRIEFGRSVKSGSNYFNGNMHEVRIWNDSLDIVKFKLLELKRLSGSENGLIGYYPMNEGKGSVAFDKAHGSHAAIIGQWSMPSGKAVALNGSNHVYTNTAFAPVTSTMDYTMELWFKGDAAHANTTLASNGKGDGTDPDGSLNLFSLGFEGGLLTFRNNGYKVQADGAFLDNQWHHVAVAVNRNAGSAQLSVDGKLNQFFSADNLGGLAAPNTALGARTFITAEDAVTPQFDRHFKGNLDEFRIWNTFLNPSVIADNNNVRLQGTELGLLAYYPFEADSTVRGITDMIFTLRDAKVQEIPTVTVPYAWAPVIVESDEAAPMKRPGAVEKLNFDFVVNNDALIINLKEPKESIDKTVITFQVTGVEDLNGNTIASPITWSAYIDRNQLKWGDREIVLEKEVSKPMSFASYLVNSSGNSQRYSIYNQPSWMQVSPSSGSIDPTGNQKITFTVNPALNIGSYEEIIYMRNDNGEIEALKVKLVVKGKKPDWVVKAADYDYSMVVYGKIRINSVFSINKEDMLGAFINGKCVGVTNNLYNSADNLWYTLLNVYTNSLDPKDNRSLEFRIWQAATGKTFRALPSRAVAFTNNAIIGTTISPVIFDGGAQYYQDITVNQNWNWLSFNLRVPTGVVLDTLLLNGVWTQDDVIKNETAAKGDDVGVSTYTTNGGWKGSLKMLNNTALFKLKAATAQSLPVGGIAVNVKTTAIPLKGAQWNYIAYLPQVNATLKEALAGYGAVDEDVIKSQTGFAMYSKQNGWIGSLTYLEPGKGYMLYRKRLNDTAFHYPSITGSIGGRVVGLVNPNVNEVPVAANYTHADNMTFVTVVAPGFDLRSGDNVLAYVNGELRGRAKPLPNPETRENTWFFTVGGEAEQPVVFVVERSGEIIAQSSTILSYRSNTNIGTLVKPVELHFRKPVSEVRLYPNPFLHEITIAAELKGLPQVGDHQVQVSVFDVTGRMVLQMPAKAVAGTGFITTWNGRNSAGKLTTNGVYFIKVTIDGVPHIHKVVKQ